VISEPAYFEFTDSTELLPVIYESVDGDWQSQIQADVPEGFVATPGTMKMNTSVTTSQTDVAQFTVVDVGSDWSYTTVTHRLKHKGKNMTIVHKAKMSNKQPPKIK